ncbi:MAG: serine hydrolase [Burkholderiaceae bacterium]
MIDSSFAQPPRPLEPRWRETVDYAIAHQSAWSRDPATDARSFGIHHLDDPPHNRLLGPVFARGPASGMIAVDGRVVCSWGEPDAPDMTFSVTKTYLALTAGVAHDRGILPPLDEPVRCRLPGLGFDSAHNRRITWEHLLQFTSEWQGSCFGVPDRIDRYRVAGFQPAPTERGRKGDARALARPGTYWEYNDVRINQFSLALMHLLRRPVPELFAEAIATPLGLSSSWRWSGYDNAWFEIDGRPMQSVPGGGHWGGGMRISARDQLRIAQMMLDDGRWNGRTVLSSEWLQRMRTPCDIAPFYGYFLWLNHGHRPIPAAEPDDFFAVGVGAQVIWHSPRRRLVAAIRWLQLEAFDGLVACVDRAL